MVPHRSGHLPRSGVTVNDQAVLGSSRPGWGQPAARRQGAAELDCAFRGAGGPDVCRPTPAVKWSTMGPVQWIWAPFRSTSAIWHVTAGLALLQREDRDSIMLLLSSPSCPPAEGPRAHQRPWNSVGKTTSLHSASHNEDCQDYDELDAVATYAQQPCDSCTPEFPTGHAGATSTRQP
jgi:hypothetical protein